MLYSLPVKGCVYKIWLLLEAAFFLFRNVTQDGIELLFLKDQTIKYQND